ncbi:universal stress protein UspB, partial [Salmonella enterica subsp. enterica serovar Weltevreden]|nr:universal stress protein UspB [Salmonella enterica subsp. enterica serovar Weltevreden]
MISTVSLFWALCVVCIVNMARYFSSLRALLVVLRGCDPLLYQYVDGGGFFTTLDLTLYIQTFLLSYDCDNFLRIYSRGERYPSAL